MQEPHHVVRRQLDEHAGDLRVELGAEPGLETLHRRDEPLLLRFQLLLIYNAISHRLRERFQLFDPLVNLTIDNKAVNEPQMRAMAAQMVVALGLALRCDRERRQ